MDLGWAWDMEGSVEGALVWRVWRFSWFWVAVVSVSMDAWGMGSGRTGRQIFGIAIIITEFGFRLGLGRVS